MKRFIGTLVVAWALAVGCMDLDPLPDRPDAAGDTDTYTDTDTDVDTDVDTDTDSDTDTDTDTDTDADTDTDTDTTPDTDGNLVWAKSAGGTDDDYGQGISALSDGSAFVTGYFNDVTTFGEGETDETSLTSLGYADIFVAKYSADGALLWAARAGGDSADTASGISALSDGSSLVTGSFLGTATFGEGETNETALASAGVGDIFVAKYNADGTLAWAKRAGGSGYDDTGTGVAALSDGSAFVTGSFGGTATFGAGEANETAFTSTGSATIFVAKYNSDGSLAWAKSAGGNAYMDSGMGVSALSSDGSAVVTGHFGDTAIFGEGETNETSLTSAGTLDIFVAKYNADGTLAWAKRAGGSSYYDVGHGIAAMSDGSALVTGYYRPQATFGPGETNETTLSGTSDDIFVAKYNADGTLAWAKRAGGNSQDVAHGIAALSDGSALVTGFYLGTATFGPGEANETALVSVGGDADVFVAKLDTDGSLVWARRAGGSCGNQGVGISVLSDGSALATGFYCETATFGLGEVNQTLLTSAGGVDVFVAKFGP